MLRCKVQRSMRERTEGQFSCGQKGLRLFVGLKEKVGCGWSNPSPARSCESARERHPSSGVGWDEHQRIPQLWSRNVGIRIPT